MTIAPLHSMDIPHVTAIEYPLVVNNTEKAIQMVGGKHKISKVINSPDKSSNANYHTTIDNTLELRLRNDRFHHPIQSSYNTNEKVLLKVRIPKSKLPSNYKEMPIVDLIQESCDYSVTPVAIIDKTYSFKSISDFQSCVKNNPVVSKISRLNNASNYHELYDQFKQLDELSNLQDYQNPEYYDDSKNPVHNLPPPPIFSPIRFPFDYKYQKNPFTTIVKDEVSGEVKVVSTKSKVKLHTKMITYTSSHAPTEPAPELQKNLLDLQTNKPPVNTSEHLLLQCIEWLNTVFEIKPIWLRKHLDDIAPPDLKRSVKPALPYVTYIYQSGPWRFCNVKLGINPKQDSKYWVYQSEYFRIPSLKFVAPKDHTKRIVPSTITDKSEIAISDHLFFSGTSLPSTVTYQIGDILDSDITTIIKDHQSAFGSTFLRETPDFQDGWINKQTMEVIRRIIRYKLNRIAKEESIDQNKIYKIINTDYTGNDDDESHEEEGVEEHNGDDDGDDNHLEDEEANDGHDDIIAEQTALESIDETSLMNNLNKFSDDAASKLTNLVGFIKQDDIKSEED
jgi:general transcription factor 3C polypeptide 5 (transcription factor C subunit 1)